MNPVSELFTWISEFLFYLTSGVMLINTPWIIVWVGFWSIMMVMPLILLPSKRPWGFLHSLVFVSLAVFSFTMAIGPGLKQLSMMVECTQLEIENTEVVLQGQTYVLETINVEVCRTKENFYDEFGDWTIMNMDEIIELIEEEVRVDVYGDLYGHDKVAEILSERLMSLEVENTRLREQNTEMSWRLDPDRMGGQFTSDEVSHNGWRL